MRRLLDGHDNEQKELLDEKIHDLFSHMRPRQHRRQPTKADELADSVDPESGWRTIDRRERPRSHYPTGRRPAHRRSGVDLGEAEEGNSNEYATWRWWRTLHALKAHHVYEIGYVACTIQLFGVTLCGVTAIIILPGILDHMKWWQELAK
jgi:hypothetical protein